MFNGSLNTKTINLGRSATLRFIFLFWSNRNNQQHDKHPPNLSSGLIIKGGEISMALIKECKQFFLVKQVLED